MAEPTKTSVAFHESGHATAAVLAFRMAQWLPRPRPAVLVRRVEITQDTGEWRGHCVATNVYSVAWPRHRLASRYKPLMQSQVSIHLAGGLAEAAHRGVRRKNAILAYALDHCDMDEDMLRARVVLDDLNALARCSKYDEQHFAGRTRVLLALFWPAVEAVAAALIEHGRVEGEAVEQIVIEAMADRVDALRPLARKS